MYEFAIIWDWLAFAVRWLHVIVGIAWIGSSAALYTRRGRPKAAGWRSRQPTHSYGLDELSG
jgi:hypothetical protein